MSLKRAFHFLTFAAALWAFLALVLTGQVHLVAIALFLTFFALAVARVRWRIWMPPGWMWTIINLLMFGIALHGWFVLEERMYTATYFFFYLELNKLLTAQRNRDYLQIYALTFFHMLAAAVSTESVIFAPVLAIYVFLILAAMIVFTIKRDAEQAFEPIRKTRRPELRPHRLPEDDEEALRRIASAAFLDRRFLFWIASASVLLLMLGTMIFWIVPRTGQTNFIPGLGRRAEGPRTSGFADNITFAGLGDIQTNPIIVMRAVPYPEYLENRPEFLRIRGTALDYFLGNQWVKSAYIQGRITPSSRHRRINFPEDYASADSGGQRLRVRITLEPEGSGYFFLLDQPTEFSLDESRQLDVDYESRSIKSAMGRFQTISYDTEGLIPPARHEGAAPPVASPATGASIPGEEMPLLVSKSLEQIALLPAVVRGLLGEAVPTAATASAVPPPYLQVPRTQDMATVERVAREWTQGLRTDYEKARAIERQLRTTFGYSLNVDYAGRDNHLTYFLTVSRSGHCEYFATTMALMLRTLGIPSRIINGYLTDEWSNTGRRYIIRQEHAHSWVEAIVDESGRWMTFDPTPASGVGSNRIGISLYHRLSSLLDGVRIFWYNRFIDYNMEDQRQGMFAFLRFLRFTGETTSRGLLRAESLWQGDGASRLTGRQVLGLVLMTAAAAIVAYILWQFRRRAAPRQAERRHARRTNLAILRPYLDLIGELEHRYPRAPSQTPLDFARQLRDITAGALEGLVPLTRGYYEIRYNGGQWTPAMDEWMRQVRERLDSGLPRASATQQPPPQRNPEPR